MPKPAGRKQWRRPPLNGSVAQVRQRDRCASRAAPRPSRNAARTTTPRVAKNAALPAGLTPGARRRRGNAPATQGVSPPPIESPRRAGTRQPRLCRRFSTTRLLLCLLLTATSLRADAFAELHTTLQRLDGADPVSGTIEFVFADKTGDERKPQLSEGRATAAFALGADGLRIAWSPDQLAAARQEAEAGAGKPKQPAPTRKAMSKIDAAMIQDFLGASTELSRRLARATLLAETEDCWHDQPARLLTFKLDPPLSAVQKKVAKKIDSTARVWVATDGTPLAAESTLRVTGRAMVVIGFEHSEQETFTFARFGNRLVVTSHKRETVDEGGGQHSQKKTNVTLRLTEG